MTPAKTRILAVSAVAAIGLAFAAFAYLRNGTAQLEFQGWIEAYFIFVSPDEAGRVETLAVREGDAVTAGAPLFALDAELQRAAVAETEAAVVNAKITFERAAGAAEEEPSARRRCSTMPSRPCARPRRASTRRAPGSSAGALPALRPEPSRRSTSGRARWCRPAVPSCRCCRRATCACASSCRRRCCPRCTSAIAIAVRCDGCAGDLVARVSFISVQAEFTPPVIYSQEERARLVFRIEALPEKPEDLRVGQPVSVALQPAAGVSHARK